MIAVNSRTKTTKKYENSKAEFLISFVAIIENPAIDIIIIIKDHPALRRNVTT